MGVFIIFMRPGLWAWKVKAWDPRDLRSGVRSWHVPHEIGACPVSLSGLVDTSLQRFCLCSLHWITTRPWLILCGKSRKIAYFDWVARLGKGPEDPRTGNPKSLPYLDMSLECFFPQSCFLQPHHYVFLSWRPRIFSFRKSYRPGRKWYCDSTG